MTMVTHDCPRCGRLTASTCISGTVRWSFCAVCMEWEQAEVQRLRREMRELEQQQCRGIESLAAHTCMRCGAKTAGNITGNLGFCMTCARLHAAAEALGKAIVDRFKREIAAFVAEKVLRDILPELEAAGFMKQQGEEPCSE